MRVFLRRIIVIIILLLLIYLVYGWINPTGAEKIKSQLQSIEFPRRHAQDKVNDLLIKEVGKDGSKSIDEQLGKYAEEEEAIVTWAKDSDPIILEQGDKPVEKNQQQPNQVESIVNTDNDDFDRTKYLQDELKKENEKDNPSTDPIVEPTQPINQELAEDLLQQFENDPEINNLESPKWLTDQELKEIQDLLRSLLE